MSAAAAVATPTATPFPKLDEAVQRVKAGYRPAEKALVNLLQDSKCRMRVAAAEAIRDLKLKSAKDALADLKEKGGPDDRERVLFLGCNSREAAGEALAELED